MDRIHFIEHAIERLDDEAFAAFLMWFDRYADLRWAGRWADDGMSTPSHVISHAVRQGGAPPFAPAVAHSVASTPTRVCEPQLSAWSARAAALEE